MCTLTFVDPLKVDERAFSYAVRIRKRLRSLLHLGKIFFR